MKDLNNVVLTGRLLKDPKEGKQYFVSTTGIDVFRTQLLVKKAVVKQEDNYDAGLVHITSFGKLAKTMVQNLRRGEKIAIRGHLGLGEQDQNQVIVEELIFIEKKEDAKEFSKTLTKLSKQNLEGKKGVITTSLKRGNEDKNKELEEKRVFPE